jgi:hypothetical protein
LPHLPSSCREYGDEAAAQELVRRFQPFLVFAEMSKYLPEITTAWSSRHLSTGGGCEFMQFPSGDVKMVDNCGFGHL